MTLFLNIQVLIFTSLLLWIIYGAIYRLYLSPLSKFPGPKLAALTRFYEFYFNHILDYQFIWEIKRMHEKYGPIVRISPWELHIDDPDYYDELYAGSGKKREKYLWFVAGGGSPGSSFETIPHDLHRLRRSAINHFFSKRSIHSIEPLIISKISLLSDIFHTHFLSKEPLDLRVCFSSLTLDIISDYCYGESFGALTDKKVALEWYITLQQIMDKALLFMHFPFLLRVMGLLPDGLAGPVLRHHRNSRNKVSRVLRHEDSEAARQDTIFHELRDSDQIPSNEKTVSRLADEGNILIGAGSETTGQTLSVLFFYLLDNPDMLQRVRDEVNGIGEITWGKLEQLPFLTACITEVLRLSSVVSVRLPRISPNEDLQFGKWIIPAGTPTSMTSLFIHHSPTIFPSPLTFDPARWLPESNSNADRKLEKYFVPFTKGSRGCAGINLAYAELYLATAHIIQRFEFQLYETTSKDVEIERAHFVTAPRKGSKGVRVLVVGDRGA